MERNGGAVLDRFPDRVLVQVALLVIAAEDLERPLAVRGPVYRRAGEADVGGVRQRTHQVVAEVAARGAMGLIDQHEDVVSGVHLLRDVVELVDHRDNQPSTVAAEILQMLLRFRHLNVAETNRFQVAEELGLQLVPIHQHQHRRVFEHRVLDELLGYGNHRVGLARALRVPDQPPPLVSSLARSTPCTARIWCGRSTTLDNSSSLRVNRMNSVTARSTRRGATKVLTRVSKSPAGSSRQLKSPLRTGSRWLRSRT